MTRSRFSYQSQIQTHLVAAGRHHQSEEGVVVGEQVHEGLAVLHFLDVSD